MPPDLDPVFAMSAFGWVAAHEEAFRLRVEEKQKKYDEIVAAVCATIEVVIGEAAAFDQRYQRFAPHLAWSVGR